MKLTQLRYFIAAAEDQNFNRAAARIRVSEPALSRQVRELERELGFDLFIRTGRGVALSPAGAHFLNKVRATISDLEAAVADGRRVAAGEFGALRIAYCDMVVTPEIVPQSFHACRTRHPDIALTISSMLSAQQLQALRDDRIDVGFLFNRPDGDPAFAHMPLRTENLALCLSSNHPLAARPSVRLADLAEENFILLSRSLSPVLFDTMIAGCRAGGLGPKTIQEVGNAAAAYSLISFGLGVGFVTVWAPPPPGLVFKPVEDLHVPFQLELVWKADNSSPTLARFVDAVREQAAKGAGG